MCLAVMVVGVEICGRYIDIPGPRGTEKGMGTGMGMGMGMGLDLIGFVTRDMNLALAVDI